MEAFGIAVVIIHQGTVDSPASQVCVLFCVCYIAVHIKGGAWSNQIQRQTLSESAADSQAVDQADNLGNKI